MRFESQEATHLQQMLTQATLQTEKLERQIVELKSEVNDLNDLNKQLHKKVETTNLERIDDLKTAVSKRLSASDSNTKNRGKSEKTSEDANT